MYVLWTSYILLLKIICQCKEETIELVLMNELEVCESFPLTLFFFGNNSDKFITVDLRVEHAL